eukprot:12919594-Prorocentrum_lima.AAC.1
MSQPDAVDGFGLPAPDKKLRRRMTILDLYNRELYHYSHYGSTVKKREYTVPASATKRNLIVYVRHA